MSYVKMTVAALNSGVLEIEDTPAIYV